MLEIYSRISKLYQNPGNFTTVFCSPGPAELYTQTFLLLHAGPTVLCV